MRSVRACPCVFSFFLICYGAGSKLPGRGPTNVDDGPAPAH